MLRLRTAALLLGASLLAGCDKGGPQDILGSLPGSRIKFFNFGVNAPSVNFYVGEQKMTAISSSTGSESTLGTAYGSAGAAGLYTAITPGQYTVTGRVTATTDNGLAVAQLPATLQDGKAYSFYMSGIYDAAAKRTDAFLVEDVYPATVDYTITSIRFVNAISNSQPMQLILRNVASGAEAPVGSAVAYKSATPFVDFGVASVFNPGGIVDLIVRAPGGTTTLVTRTGATFGVGRVYTVTARGDMTVTSTTATTRPQLDITANR